MIIELDKNIAQRGQRHTPFSPHGRHARLSADNKPKKSSPHTSDATRLAAADEEKQHATAH